MKLIELLDKRAEEYPEGKTAFIRERLGLNPSTISRYANGQLNITLATVQNVARLATETGDSELMGAVLCLATGLPDNGRSDELGALWLEATSG